jgi:hypothetical protein
VVGDASATVVGNASATVVGNASATLVDYGSIVADDSIIREYCIVNEECRACIDDCIAIVLNGSIVYHGRQVVHGSINGDSAVIHKVEWEWQLQCFTRFNYQARPCINY